MLKRCLIALAGLTLLTTGPAFAGPPPATGGQPPATSGAPEDKEVRVFNFDGDTISTDFLKPGTLLIEGLRRGRRSSLIEVRLDFVAELLRSAEDI